ncbi:hypothetical protein V8G54_010680 [Vigna mungo]|uniref:Ubiquitin-related modifier 1 homolog n=1 Tax=Vigna mungo TaxID=3915 RepID=A0AAQ3NXZ3_VIGMU
MQLTLEFGGGLELLCDSKKIHNVNIEQQNGEGKLIMKDLLSWVRTNLIKERPEMFMKGDTVRPGVLVLVNDCDWELSGQLDTSLEEKDVVAATLSFPSKAVSRVTSSPSAPIQVDDHHKRKRTQTWHKHKQLQGRAMAGHAPMVACDTWAPPPCHTHEVSLFRVLEHDGSFQD